MTLQKVAQIVLGDARDGIGWIVLFKSGRSWDYEVFYPDFDDSTNVFTFDDAEDLERILNIAENHPDAIVVNGYYSNLGDAECMTRDSLAGFLRWQYEGQYSLLSDKVLRGADEPENFELFMGCLGNGTTVCNKAVEENGDYKKVAHISNSGKIKWYVEPSTVPGDALLKIEHCANTSYENFREWFDSMNDLQKYSYLLDRARLSVMLEAMNNEKTLAEKIQYLLSNVEL